MKQNVAPTRSNLIKLKDELKFAELGYELLDQKRNILVIELLNLVDQAVEYESRVNASLDNAYDSLRLSVMQMGKLKVGNLTGAINVENEIKLRERRVMGVKLPVVETEFKDKGPYFSPLDTSFMVEEALDSFKESLELMGRLAELKVSIMRLALEVKKTIRKVNALQKIAIPDLRETLDFTVSRLEEAERENFILMKLVKTRLEKKKERM
ncbi:MAG: V-type ATP synthase subunit D [Spirochaetales bacterium]|uniref:V-type ATP synthase subunit D n=1 Tax=Candidatus Thalassospirochaeta sargassi TaxID=3119039 RepID=A0AAJ1ML88_9SPIO|nr:V-type ATP synthase subunit D [Spirochaetales bacterium]